MIKTEKLKSLILFALSFAALGTTLTAGATETEIAKQGAGISTKLEDRGAFSPDEIFTVSLRGAHSLAGVRLDLGSVPLVSGIEIRDFTLGSGLKLAHQTLRIFSTSSDVALSIRDSHGRVIYDEQLQLSCGPTFIPDFDEPTRWGIKPICHGAIPL